MKNVSAVSCSCCTPFYILKRTKTALFTPHLEQRTRGGTIERNGYRTRTERNDNGTVMVRNGDGARTQFRGNARTIGRSSDVNILLTGTVVVPRHHNQSTASPQICL